MTKEPTKWMLKGYGKDLEFLFQKLTFNNLLTQPFGAIEYKLSPSFSVQLEGRFRQSIYTPVSDPASNLIGQNNIEMKGISLQLTGEIRWYHNMARRIKEGKAANNFSGNYISLRYGTLFKNANRKLSIQGNLRSQNGTYQTDFLYSVPNNEINIAYGIQRRFFRFGLIDMSINLSHKTQDLVQQKIIFPNHDNSIVADPTLLYNSLQSDYQPFGSKSSWQIFTKVQFGIGLADFKRKATFSKCNVFRCYENQSRMFKIAWPIVYLSPSYQRLSGALGFEQKLFNSPFSLNTYLNYNLFNTPTQQTWFYNTPTQSFVQREYGYYDLNYALTLQSRYYFLLANRIKKGKSGNHLSGFYAGLNTLATGSKSFYEIKGVADISDSDHDFAFSLLVGFQQKLFKNGFIDAYYNIFSKKAAADIVYPFSNIQSLMIKVGFAL